MSQCSLCGGKLALNGKCTECGLDNTKNDKKYRLNVHNEKGYRLHQGDCDGNLNQERSLQKTHREHTEKAVHEQSAGTAMLAREEKRKQQKKMQQRSQTGTVKKKKKGGCLGWIVMILAILGALGNVSEEVFYEIGNFIEEKKNFQSLRPEPIADGAYESAEVDVSYVQTVPVETEKLTAELISPIAWNEDVDQYYTASLEAGIYTGGYDIPAGVYQLTCTGGSTYAHWWNPKAQEGGQVTLYSEEERVAYEAELEKRCEYLSYSERFELEEGGVLYVELPAEVSISGNRNSLKELKERKPQNLSGEVVLDTDTILIAGEDFDAGTYDVTAEGGYGLFMDIDRSGSYYYISLEEGESFYRFPFTEGTKLELNLIGETTVLLKPSY